MYTFSELMNDWNTVKNSYGFSKKDLAVKYNCKAKNNDIEEAILLALRNNRNSRSEFTNDDIRAYLNYKVYDNYDKMLPIFEAESIVFLNYVKEYYKNRLGNHFNIASKIANGTKISLSLESANTKYLIKNYCNIVRYLNEHDTDNNSEYVKEVNNINNIFNRISMLMTDYEADYYKRMRDYLGIKYENLPNVVKELKNAVKELKDEKAKAENTNESRNAIYKISCKIEKYLAEIRINNNIFKRYTKEEYVEKEMIHVMENFKMRQKELSERIFRTNMNNEKLEISNVSDDPKFFSMMITDGENTMYARSIIAATYSEKVSEHFRFIITNNK